MSLIDILLSNDIPEAEVKEFKIKRLSKAWNTEGKIRLKGLGYNKAGEIMKSTGEDVNVHIIIAGDEEKVFKNKELMEKYNAVTPAELVKKILTPGEIAKLSDAVLALSGYNTDTVEEVKKNWQKILN